MNKRRRVWRIGLPTGHKKSCRVGYFGITMVTVAMVYSRMFQSQRVDSHLDVDRATKV